MKKVFLSMILLSVSVAQAADCSKEAEAAAVNAAKDLYNPGNTDDGVQVSDRGSVFETKGVSVYRNFYLVNVTDEVGESFWSVVTNRNCSILKTALAYSE
jgi:hypothetical protein